MKKNIKFTHLDKTDSIEQLSDSTYFSDVRSIVCDENYIYFSDYNRNQIFKLDDDLTLVKTFGGLGDGPGEFKGASKISIDKDTLFVVNDFKRSINLFSKSGNYLKFLSLSNHLSNPETSLNFIAKNSNLYMSNTMDSSSLSVIYHSEKLKLFGNVFQFKNEKQRMIRNGRHLFKSKDVTIAISDNLPIIEIYGNDLELKRSYDYSKDLSFVKDGLDIIKSKNVEENSYYEIVGDACFNDNKLYLLLYSYDDPKTVICNKVSVFNLEGDELYLEKTIVLDEDSWYSSIGVNNNSLIAFNISTSILENMSFPIKKFSNLIFCLVFFLVISCEKTTKENAKTLGKQERQKTSILGKEINAFKEILEKSVNTNDKVIFFYSGFDCNTCIDIGFNIVKRIDSMSGMRKCFVIGGGTQTNFHQEQQRNNYYHSIYNDPEDQVRKELKYIRTPLLLYLNELNEVSEVLFPDYNRSEEVLKKEQAFVEFSISK